MMLVKNIGKPKIRESKEQKKITAIEQIGQFNRKNNEISIYLPISLKEKENRKIVMKDIDGWEIDLFAFLNSQIEQIYRDHSIVITVHSNSNFLKKAMHLILTNISDEKFSVGVFSKMMGMSQSRLNLKLKGLTNHTTIEFINSVKMDCARKLIQQGIFSIKEIAYKVGFEDSNYFSRAFKKHFGNCPSYYLMH